METTAGLDLGTYQPVGDKENSSFFVEYLPKIYDRRRSAGLDDLVERMIGVVVQVETGDALAYLCELYLMTPYRLAGTWLNSTHRIFVLSNPRSDTPAFIVMEPVANGFEDEFTRLNRLYPKAALKPNARYMGELFDTLDLTETVAILRSHDVRFVERGDTANSFFTLDTVRCTVPSDYTGNRVGYVSGHIGDGEALGIGERVTLTAGEWERLDAASAMSEQLGIPTLVLGLDHLATRVLAGEREDAILEFLTLSPYYFWGAYDIAAMNSSTNVTRHPGIADDKLSPAKVFTANNTPSFVNSFEGRPMPTEDFVRNYGRRLHHHAFEVLDGDRIEGVKNVDEVVMELQTQGIDFLADVVGQCNDAPDLKQIFSKHSQYSILITEYVERCHGFRGFFTKSNVAALTAAADNDERLDHGHVFD